MTRNLHACAPPAVEAISYMSRGTGAVPLTPAQVHTPGIPVAAAVVSSAGVDRKADPSISREAKPTETSHCIGSCFETLSPWVTVSIVHQTSIDLLTDDPVAMVTRSTGTAPLPNSDLTAVSKRRTATIVLLTQKLLFAGGSIAFIAGDTQTRGRTPSHIYTICVNITDTPTGVIHNLHRAAGTFPSFVANTAAISCLPIPALPMGTTPAHLSAVHIISAWFTVLTDGAMETLVA